jgi:hypothetical protein
MTKEFSPRKGVDAEDIPEIRASVRQNNEHRSQQRAKRADAAVTHEVDRESGESAEAREREIEEVEREEDVVEWRDPVNLEAPPARPGYVQRWVRFATRRDGDPSNFSRARSEGWRPVRLSNVPDGYSPPTINHRDLGDIIGVEGLILCEMPITVAKQRKAYYDKLLRAQNEAIERDIHKDERPGQPIQVTRRTQITRGRKPEIGD